MSYLILGEEILSKMLSDEDRKRILSLWKDEDFSASFSGVASLQVSIMPN